MRTVMASDGGEAREMSSGAWARVLPHEHGAWVQLLLPLATALALGSPTRLALVLALGALATFLLHEPVLVLLGRRGERALRELLFPAGVACALWLAVAATCWVFGFAFSPSEVIGALITAALLGAWVFFLAWRGREKTTSGEIVVAWALASAALPVALASGVELRQAVTTFGVWCGAFTSATLAVRAVLERTRTKGAADPGRMFAAISLALLAFAVALASAWQIRWQAAVALLPPVAVAVAVCLGRVSAQRLRQVGWSFIAASVVTLALLVLGLR